MKTNIPDNCGNSPRSLLAIEIAISLASNEYDKLEPVLAEDFTLSITGGGEEIARSELQAYMEKATQSKISIEKFDILTSISHGKYAAVSSRAHMSNGVISNSHDLYEFKSAGSQSKLQKVTSYAVDSKH